MFSITGCAKLREMTASPPTSRSRQVADTAFYCCGVRMLDAEAAVPLVGDQFAHRFMTDRGRAVFEPFVPMKLPNLSTALRCRIIDGWLRQALEGASDTLVVTVGAGFDSRPYRIPGGRWVELDQPELFEVKEAALPAQECPNPLQRIPIRFEEDELVERLRDVSAGRPRDHGGSYPPILVVEGVFFYLDEEETAKTLRSFAAVFPRHRLFLDLMTKRFFERFGARIHKRLKAAGATFSSLTDHPERIFEETGYSTVGRVAMFDEAHRLGALWRAVGIPSPLSWLFLNVLAPDLRGYAVYQMEKNEVGPPAEPPIDAAG